MKVYFKYKVKDLTSYQKRIQQTNIKFLENCDIEGYKHILKNNGYVYFSIENQLYRLLKLSYLDNREMEFKMKTLNFLIKSSIRTEKDDIPEGFASLGGGSGYWFKADTYEYYSTEKSLNRAEQKDRIRNHNRYYKQKYKLKK